MPLDPYVDAVAGHLERTGHPEAAADRERLRAACAAAQEKAQTLEEVWPLIRFAFEPPVEDERAWRKVMGDEEAPRLLAAARETLAEIPAFDGAGVEEALAPLPERLGAKPGKVFQPIRVALTGSTVSPGIFETVSLVGREEALARIDTALGRLGGRR
jgi:glutamyl-tRNA synthetase